MNQKIGLDISFFISEIKRIVAEKVILSDNRGRYYGKLSIYFEDGKINHIEKFETIK